MTKNVFYNLNNVELSGNLTKDVKASTTRTGKQFAYSTIAVHAGKHTTYIHLVGWNKSANNLANLKKGQAVELKGHLTNDSLPLDNGKTIQTLELVVKSAKKMSFKKHAHTNKQTDNKIAA